jgi:DNA-binding LytR/AlgR family response regulator
MSTQYYFYRFKNNLKQIKINDILVLEAHGNHTKFIAKKYTHTVRVTLDAALSQLPENRFSRINRSYAVVLEHVDVIGRDFVKFYFQKQLFEYTVSNKYYPEFRKQIKIIEAPTTSKRKKTGKKELFSGNEEA